jgi:hypothetical protein
MGPARLQRAGKRRIFQYQTQPFGLNLIESVGYRTSELPPKPRSPLESVAPKATGKAGTLEPQTFESQPDSRHREDLVQQRHHAPPRRGTTPWLFMPHRRQVLSEALGIISALYRSASSCAVRLTLKQRLGHFPDGQLNTSHFLAGPLELRLGSLHVSLITVEDRDVDAHPGETNKADGSRVDGRFVEQFTVLVKERKSPISCRNTSAISCIRIPRPIIKIGFICQHGGGS